MNALVDTRYEQKAQYRTKPRWYYSHIIDWMMANPSGKLADCAAHFGKHPNTIGYIVRSDMFQAALSERKRQFAALQDARIHQKLTEVSLAAMDQILTTIEAKKNSLPLETLNTVADGALKRLGYGIEPRGPAVQVNVNQTNQVAVPVSASDLNDARQLLKQHQQTLAGEPMKVIEGAASSPEVKSEEDVVASVIPQP